MMGRKHNQKGRSTGEFASARFRKANRPPAGEPFVWFTKRMLESPAYQVLSGGAERYSRASRSSTWRTEVARTAHFLSPTTTSPPMVSGAARFSSS